MANSEDSKPDVLGGGQTDPVLSSSQNSHEPVKKRRQRGLHKIDNVEIGSKKKGPLPKTSPVTALIMSILLGGLFVVTVFWTDRSLDYWWTYIQRGTHDMPLWVSVITTFVLAPIILFLNLLTEIFRLMIDFID